MGMTCRCNPEPVDITGDRRVPSSPLTPVKTSCFADLPRRIWGSLVACHLGPWRNEALPISTVATGLFPHLEE